MQGMTKRERQITDEHQVQAILDTAKVLHLGLAEELNSYAVSDKPQPAGPSAMISYAVPGFTCPHLFLPLHMPDNYYVLPQVMVRKIRPSLLRSGVGNPQ